MASLGGFTDLKNLVQGIPDDIAAARDAVTSTIGTAETALQTAVGGVSTAVGTAQGALTTAVSNAETALAARVDATTAAVQALRSAAGVALPSLILPVGGADPNGFLQPLPVGLAGGLEVETFEGYGAPIIESQVTVQPYWLPFCDFETARLIVVQNLSDSPIWVETRPYEGNDFDYQILPPAPQGPAQPSWRSPLSTAIVNAAGGAVDGTGSQSTAYYTVAGVGDNGQAGPQSPEISVAQANTTTNKNSMWCTPMNWARAYEWRRSFVPGQEWPIARTPGPFFVDAGADAHFGPNWWTLATPGGPPASFDDSADMLRMSKPQRFAGRSGLSMRHARVGSKLVYVAVYGAE